MPRQKGFSLVELLVVLGIVLIISGISIPIYKNAMDTIHLQEATRNYAGILQRARINAVTNNTYDAVGIQFLPISCLTPPCDLIAYVDTAQNNPPATYATPEPMAVLGSGVIWTQTGVPGTTDLQNKVFNGTALGYPPIFGSRGLPCVPAGAVCSTQGGSDVAYATYFQSPLGKWQAVTVNPAGRIQLWSYDANASVWNQI